MEVLLTQDVEKLGRRGDVVSVSDGYARNYLMPRKIGIPPTSAAVKELEKEQKLVAVREAKKLEEIKAMAEKITTTSVTIEAKVNEEGHLYGSITAAAIAEAFEKQGVKLDPAHIELENPIKEVGVFPFKVRLHPEVQPESKIWVVQAPTEKA